MARHTLTSVFYSCVLPSFTCSQRSLAMSTTKIDPYPDEPSLFLDGMELGSGVDAVTGSVKSSALKSGFEARQYSLSRTPEEAIVLRTDATASELYPSPAALTNSVTFPRDRKLLGTNLAGPFGRSPACTLFISVDWERHSTSTIISEPELSKDAAKIVADFDKFRLKYGDYFVTRITCKMKFTIIWYCTTRCGFFFLLTRPTGVAQQTTPQKSQSFGRRYRPR